MTPRDPARFQEPGRTTPAEVNFRSRLESYFEESQGSHVEKLQNFPKYVPTQDLRRFVSRYEIYKKILSVHGSIVECGVLFGGGLMTFAQLSEIFEPLNHTRNVIGFDTFAGFAAFSPEDGRGELAAQHKPGGLAVDTHDDLVRAARLFDENRQLSHIQKVRLVRGDVCETVPRYVEEHPQLVVSLLYLDLDVFEPTRVALEHLVPRMPRGAIIAFDELNHEVWPGETVAVARQIGLRNLRIERFPFGGTVSYAVLD